MIVIYSIKKANVANQMACPCSH